MRGDWQSEETRLSYCCSASSCLVLSDVLSCPVLSPPRPQKVLSSPLRLHRPGKKTLPQNPLYNSASPRQTSCDTMKPAKKWIATIPLPHLSRLRLSCTTGYVSFNPSFFLFFFTLPPLGLNTCAKMHVLIKLQTGTRGFGSQRSSKKATLQKWLTGGLLNRCGNRDTRGTQKFRERRLFEEEGELWCFMSICS